MRSLLFVPGDSPKKLSRALDTTADALIVDLEDSVAPAAKAEARAISAEFVANHRDARTLFVRVNALETGLAEADLAAIMAARPFGIMLPKAAGPASVDRLSALLRVEEARHGVADGATRILPIVTETTAATLMTPLFRAPNPRLAGMTWGAEDLSADLGASATRRADGAYADPYRLARSLTLFAAAACDTPAVDTVFVDFADAFGLAAECAEAARDGFVGKMAIHPAQVAAINAAFTPSAEALDRAREVVDAFAAAGDLGVVAIRGAMVDRPHLRRAERLLERAASIAGAR